MMIALVATLRAITPAISEISIQRPATATCKPSSMVAECSARTALTDLAYTSSARLVDCIRGPRYSLRRNLMKDIPEEVLAFIAAVLGVEPEEVVEVVEVVFLEAQAPNSFEQTLTLHRESNQRRGKQYVAGMIPVLYPTRTAFMQ